MIFSVFRVVQPSPQSTSECFITRKIEQMAINPPPPPPKSPLSRQSVIYFLSLWNCLICIIHINRIIQYAVFVTIFFPTGHNVFKVHPWCRMQESALHAFSFYSLLFFIPFYNGIISTYVFICLRGYKYIIAGNSTFNLLRSCQTAFQSDCSIFHHH